ncbi:angiopoietin-related protein 3 [Bactrocera oleae]|uniref:angiopoietin-related protein 3 n=1 Tax=Bactrocera oleae TaxID=104688 RepID=UPI00387EB881
MEPIVIDKLLMALSVLFTTPGNYIQLNSRDVNVSSLMRIGGDNNAWQNCNVTEMKNLRHEVNEALNNQMKTKKRLESIATDLQAIKTSLSTPNPVDCSKVGEFLVNLPQSHSFLSVLCVNNEYGNNWILIAHHKVTNALVRYKITNDAQENGMSETHGEYFIGFEKLRAITDNQLYELLIVETDKNNKQWYDHYQTVAFDANNKVKQLGQHRTNRADKSIGLLAHAEAVNEKLRFDLNSSTNTAVTIYLRKTSLHDVPFFKYA